MGFPELCLLAVGLSMDAFAVSICKGLAMGRLDRRSACIVGLWFGGFQALMPLLGYLAGSRFLSLIQQIDHWIAFGLLALIGGNMVREALGGSEESDANADLSAAVMLMLAIATSIDAFAVGITFAALRVRIVPAITLIGCTTFCISYAGVVLGHLTGSRYRKTAEIIGGVILILTGIRVLLSHLMG